MNERCCQQNTDVDCRGSLSVVILQKGPRTPKTMGWIFRNSEDPDFSVPRGELLKFSCGSLNLILFQLVDSFSDWLVFQGNSEVEVAGLFFHLPYLMVTFILFSIVVCSSYIGGNPSISCTGSCNCDKRQGIFSGNSSQRRLKITKGAPFFKRK